MFARTEALRAECAHARASRSAVGILHGAGDEEHEIQTELVQTLEDKLEAAVQAPVPGGVDPTAWLPDEILEHVLSLLSPVDLVQARYLAVCRRWRSVGLTTRMDILRERARWIAYSTSMIAPTALAAHEGVEWSEHAQITAIGPDGTVYSGGVNGAIWVWAPTTHAPLRILGTAPGIQITALVVAADGTVFAGATSGTVYAFSGVDGAPLHNWVVANGASVAVLALAPDDTMVYSMTSQLDVTAWSTDLGVAGALRTLIAPGIGAAVAYNGWEYDASLAVGPDGTVYGAFAEPEWYYMVPGGGNHTPFGVHVWSGADGTHLRHINLYGASMVAASTGGVYFSTGADLWACTDDGEVEISLDKTKDGQFVMRGSMHLDSMPNSTTSLTSCDGTTAACVRGELFVTNQYDPITRVHVRPAQWHAQIPFDHALFAGRHGLRLDPDSDSDCGDEPRPPPRPPPATLSCGVSHATVGPGGRVVAFVGDRLYVW